MTAKQGRPADYIALMLATAMQAQSYIEGLSKEDFLADQKTQDAVILKLLVIGELAAKLLDEHADFVANYPMLPWRQMKGMRNRMAHGYFDRNLDVVWDTVQAEIPRLEANLRSI
jgi:uncharacterized protein with HEPN domain